MYLDDAIRQAQAAVEQKFLFRKIGLPFDYASSPEDFPSKSFANAKEARANQPNPTGYGAGYHFSCRNHGLLFDGYLLRVETGIESSGDEAILDRLIGGLIRLATVAPKAFLVGGLAPDGRGFYGTPKRENHAAWAFSAMRGLTTAAIAPESQEKFRSIAGKWIDRFKRDKYRITCIDGKPAPGGDISRPDAECGPYLLAMLLTAAKASGDERDMQLYAQMAEENERARFGEFTPEEGWEKLLDDLLWRQAALSVVAEHDPDPDRVALARARMREYAAVAAGHVAAWRARAADPAAAPLDLEWRKFPKAAPEENPYGFVPPESWARLEAEEPVVRALTAAYILFLAGDKSVAEGAAEDVAEGLRTLAWGDLAWLNAVAPAMGVHARGMELGFWDEELFDSKREAPSSETSFAAKYMEPDYDERNPDKAGHSGTPPGKKRDSRKAEGNGNNGGAHKKRRRRKKRPN